MSRPSDELRWARSRDGHVAAISESLNRCDGVLDRYDEVDIHADDLHRKMTFENRSQHFIPAARL